MQTITQSEKGLHLIVVPFVSQAMRDEAKFESAETSNDLIKWTISDFQANLPGVRMFSFLFYCASGLER